MLHSTRGIVIHTLKFSETSIIAKIYTELFGLQSYLVKGIRSPRSRLKSALFQPLTILDLSVYHKEKSTLQHLKEAHNIFPYKNLPFDIGKSSIALFIDELVFKTIREEETHPELYRFLENACVTLDQAEGDFQHFHLYFAIRLTKYLGFWPDDNFSEQKKFFNLSEGYFTEEAGGDILLLSETESRLMHLMLSAADDTWKNLPVTTLQRDEILEKILAYYRYHVAGFSGVQSHHVLHTVLS